MKVPDKNRGVAALEFGVIAPLLFLLVLGIVHVSILFNNYIELNYGVRAASRVLATGRGSTTAWTTATNTFYGTTVNLVKANIALTLSVAGKACTSDGACGSALAAASGGTSSVAATYPCDMTFMGVNFIPGCTISSQTTERVE